MVIIVEALKVNNAINCEKDWKISPIIWTSVEFSSLLDNVDFYFISRILSEAAHLRVRFSFICKVECV